jgi:hypothetical protein
LLSRGIFVEFPSFFMWNYNSFHGDAHGNNLNSLEQIRRCIHSGLEELPLTISIVYWDPQDHQLDRTLSLPMRRYRAPISVSALQMVYVNYNFC